MHEFHIIDKFFKNLTNSNEVAQNLADDVAKISLKKDQELVVSKDIIVEDVHFLLADGGFKIASKLLRTNLSDLAASGATPLYYMLGFSKNKNTNQKFIKEFVRGLKSVQDEFKLCLIGGDTVVSEKLFFSITIFGVVKKGQILARVNAKAGDLIFVSGTIGDAFLGLKNVKKEYFNHLGASEKKYFLERHFFPTPRINLGQQLLKNKLSNCAIDISDGLLADLKHICKTSELAAEIFLNEIPLSKPAKKVLEKNSQIKPLDLFCAGDDYELIFAVNPKNEKKILELAKSLPLKISCIGKFFEAADKKFEITLRDWENKKIKIKKFGYEH